MGQAGAERGDAQVLKNLRRSHSIESVWRKSMAVRRDIDVLVLGAMAIFGFLAARPQDRHLPPSAWDDRTRLPTAPVRRAGEQEDDAGRDAHSPVEIPSLGWWQVAKRTYADIGEHRVMSEAASVTYYALLAIFPALAALVSLYGLFADPQTIQQQLARLSAVIPGGAMEVIGQQLQSLSSKSGGALSVGVAIGLLVSLWSASSAIKSMFDALNAIYDARETRGFIRRTLIALVFTIGLTGFLIGAIVIAAGMPDILAAIGLGGVTNFVVRALRWPLLVVLVAALFAVVYRYGPSRTERKWRWVSPGGIIAAVLWVVASATFTFYAQQFGSYNKTYGSLGAVIGFMTWIWISAAVVLIGAALNAELEHQTARDTTTGPDLPMGARGATKADTVVQAGPDPHVSRAREFTHRRPK
jgi:membrane protein